MRQVVLLDAQDLASLKSGTPMRVSLGDGVVLEIGFDRPRVARASTNGTEPDSTLCPHCNKRFAGLPSHVRSKHPTKGLSKAGEGVKCQYCAKRFPTTISVRRHEVSGHPEKFRKRVKAAKKETASA